MKSNTVHAKCKRSKTKSLRYPAKFEHSDNIHLTGTCIVVSICQVLHVTANKQNFIPAESLAKVANAYGGKQKGMEQILVLRYRTMRSTHQYKINFSFL